MTESRDPKRDFVSWVTEDPEATGEDRAVAEVIAQGDQPTDEQRHAADHLVELGYLTEEPDGSYAVLAGDPRKWRPR